MQPSSITTGKPADLKAVAGLAEGAEGLGVGPWGDVQACKQTLSRRDLRRWPCESP